MIPQTYNKRKQFDPRWWLFVAFVILIFILNWCNVSGQSLIRYQIENDTTLWEYAGLPIDTVKSNNHFVAMQAVQLRWVLKSLLNVYESECEIDSIEYREYHLLDTLIKKYYYRLRDPSFHDFIKWINEKTPCHIYDAIMAD